MDSALSTADRVSNRKPLRGEVLLGSAAITGVIGGALVGAVSAMDALSAYFFPYEWDVTAPTFSESVLTGGFVGLLCALSAAGAWLVARHLDHQPFFRCVAAGVASAAVIMLPALLIGLAASVVTVGVALVAALLAFVLAPVLSYRPRT